MNDTFSQSSEHVFRRLEEPLRMFGSAFPSWVWLFILGAVLVVGFFYIGWMYFRDSRTIGMWWASFLGLLRASVYLLLAYVFLLPAEQTWYENKQRSKVIVLWDVSRSITDTRDDLPPQGTKYRDMPTRVDKVLEFLNDRGARFLERLEERNPVTAYRFGRGLDGDFRYFTENRYWTRAERDKVLTARADEESPAGHEHAVEHWAAWLSPSNRFWLQQVWRADKVAARQQLRAVAQGMSPQQAAEISAALAEDKKLEALLGGGPLPPAQEADFKAALAKLAQGDARAKELLRQLDANEALLEKRFFDGTAVGESVLEVLKQERNNMVQGIVVFTDGKSTEGSLQAIRDAAVSARDAKIPIFVVAVGEDRPKVAIDIVDIRVPPLIRPEDKFRVVVSVNGHDMPSEPFDIFLDVTRISRDKQGRIVEENIELIKMDEKGQIIDKSEFSIGKKITLGTAYAKEKPVFKPGNPPNAQVEFELDAATLARAAGTSAEGLGKVGIAPDDDSEIRFRARVPKDKREITELAEHVSEPADMRIQSKPLRVLLFTSAGGVREYQFLRTLLVREMDKGRAEVCIHVQTIPGAERRTGVVQDVDPSRILSDFPTKRTTTAGDKEPFYSLSSYDVVVAFDADWFQLSKEQMKLVSDWIDKDGGGLVLIAGGLNTPEIARPNLKDQVEPILTVLPVVLEDARKEDQETDVAHRLSFPQATAEMEFMRLDETDPKAEWKKGWDRFFNDLHDEEGKVVSSAAGDGTPERGFYGYFPVKTVKQNALVLAGYDTGKAEKPPFLVTGPWGEGKVCWVGSGELWRLRSYKDSYHERFWTKLLRDIGSKSVNTLNKRIMPVMSRYGEVNKFQTFEARFVDVNGDPIRRDVRTPPKLHVVLPEGTQPQKGDVVSIKEGEFAGREAKVVEAVSERDAATGAEVRKLKVLVTNGPKEAQLVEAAKVEVLSPPIDFKPRLGSRPGEELDKKNDGWFKVEFQPRSVGEYTLRVRYEDTPENVYKHRFIVRESNPELDNVRPDLEALLELASPAKLVFDRITDEPTRVKLRDALRRPTAVKENKDGKKEATTEPQTDESLKLLFDLPNARLIPDCMRTQRNDVKTRGKVQDQWDKGFVIDRDEEGHGNLIAGYRARWAQPGEASVSIFLIVAVGLLSIEWLTRKLLRLA